VQLPSDPDAQIEQLLKESRPTPDAVWRGELRRDLTRGRRSWRHLNVSRLRLSAAAAALLAAAALVASLAGAGPLASQDESVQAKQDCRFVTVTRTERVPRVVTTDGEPRVVYSDEVRTRRVKRCS
jgi:hypothetical protein